MRALSRISETIRFSLSNMKPVLHVSLRFHSFNVLHSHSYNGAGNA